MSEQTITTPREARRIKLQKAAEDIADQLHPVKHANLRVVSLPGKIEIRRTDLQQ